KLAEIMGIDADNVISIGDFYNDIDMFNASGHTVAVADAIDDIKKITDMTTKRPCMEGAVAEVLDLVMEYCEKGIPFGDPLK
ncbi:MAG: HAD hydrolase family protein, partial [Oscillospiraceae bacterium]|nr:HAD hydrolase family protein [Oscillospiraceae bacterium]